MGEHFFEEASAVADGAGETHRIFYEGRGCGNFPARDLGYDEGHECETVATESGGHSGFSASPQAHELAELFVHADKGLRGEFLVDFAEELRDEVAGIGALFRRYGHCLASWM